MKFLRFLLACLFVALAAMARSSDIRQEAIRFSPGSTAKTINASIIGYQSVAYRVGLEAGQRLTIRLEPSNSATYFNVYAPGHKPGDEALANSQLTGPMTPDLNVFDAVLTQSGEYTISVYMMRSAARRNERSDYSLAVSFSGDTGATVQADYADGLQGGPDFWEVDSASYGGQLNVHEEPSADAAIVQKVGDGYIFRNLGCRMAEGRRWCQVTSPEGAMTGWVAGDYLIEGVNRDTPIPQDSSMLSGQIMDASGRVQFPPGSNGTVVRGRIDAGKSIDYVLGAREGQFFRVNLRSDGEFTYFKILVPGGDLLYDSAKAGNEYYGQLYLSGDHTVTVYYAGGNGNASLFDIEFIIE